MASIRVPHPIPYQGSKRGLAPAIIALLPTDTARLIEPFAGAAAVSLAAAQAGCAAAFVLNDLNDPLMRLWAAVVDTPAPLADRYNSLWHAQHGRERAFYDQIRAEFNRTHEPALLLFLLARCVKAAVRYNADGAFNQSPDNRRRGSHPATMRQHLLAASALLRGRSRIVAGDYRDVLAEVTSADVVYLDPPYQGVSGARDGRYLRGLALDEFVAALGALNRRGIAFLLSYDGRTGDKQFGAPLPPSLGLRRIELRAGRSAQATLLGRTQITYESLYLSPALIARLDHPARGVQEELAL